MSGRTIAAMMVLAPVVLTLAGGGAEAGTFRAGTWIPTGCGTEPVPPSINASSSGAYQASIKDAEAYEQAAKQYQDCFVNEAQTDNRLINGALKDHQTQVQATFDKLNADSKAAADRLNKKK